MGINAGKTHEQLAEQIRLHEGLRVKDYLGEYHSALRWLTPVYPNHENRICNQAEQA